MVSSARSDLPELAELVIEVVEAIPPGSVLSYGDVAELVGRGGARQVGQVMAAYGGFTHWWRVVFADGALPTGLEERAARQLRAEGVPFGGGRVDMASARWAGPSTGGVGRA